MVAFHNPALRQEPRYEPARIIALKEHETLLNWLKRKDRLLKSRDSDESYHNNLPEELEDMDNN